MTNLLRASPLKVLFVIAILATGCSSISTNSPEISTNTPPAETSTAIYETPTEMAIIATPQKTEIPTLLPDAAEELIFDLLFDDADCDFPCWWGITPGVTTQDDASRYLSSFATTHEVGADYGQFEFSSIYLKDDFSFSITETGDGLVDWIAAKNPYEISYVLQRMGKPDEVWVHIQDYEVLGVPYVSLYLDYSSKGLVITYGNEYSMEYTWINDERMVPICEDYFEKSGTGSGMMIWGNSNSESFADFYHRISRLALEENDYLKINENSDFSVQDFYDAFSSAGGNECLNFAMREWLD